MQRVGAWGRASAVGLICLVTACGGGGETSGTATGGPPDGGPGVEPCPAGHVRDRTGQCMPAGCGAETWGNVIEAPGDLHVSAAAPDVVTNSAITLNEGLGVAVVGEGTSLIATSNVIEETKPSSVTGECDKGIEVSDRAYAKFERAPRRRL